MNLYVGNLPYSYSSSNLLALFQEFGEVKSADVVVDRDSGRSRGFGFVEMDEDGARKAMQALDGQDVDGRSLTVNEAKPRASGGDRGQGSRGGERTGRSESFRGRRR